MTVAATHSRIYSSSVKSSADSSTHLAADGVVWIFDIVGPAEQYFSGGRKAAEIVDVT